MIGANVGRPGILTQCAVEEATELDLGMRGYTAYAETISVHGTEPVFMDGERYALLESILSILLRFPWSEDALYLRFRC